MSAVRHDAIRQLCGLDHHDDPATIADWAGDPSADKFTRLLDDPAVMLLVASMDDRLVGLGGSCGDLVTLNYVDPRYRFCGISKAVMAAVEDRMADDGHGVGRLFSTRTAQRFYRSIGWQDAGAGIASQGYPMRKTLRV